MKQNQMCPWMKHVLALSVLFVVTHQIKGKSVSPPAFDPYNPFEDNEFVLLAKTVSKAFNLSHCWVCGGPLGLPSWPWTSTPLTAAQMVSNYSETNDTTWDSDETWPIQFPAVGEFCLNRTQKGGVNVGESKCQWTLTHKLVNQNLGVRIWMWVDEAGRSKGFGGFWSNKNETLVIQRFGKYSYTYKQNCEWKNNTGVWYCTGKTGRNNNTFMSPLGNDNTTYFQHPKTAVGPFANGAKAKRGHYWICGHTAYKKLPASWSGNCYVGIIRPVFFLLPETGGSRLGVRLYDALGDKNVTRNKRSLEINIGGTQKWGKNEWPPERIIQHYGPATWNPNELIAGAREPIYNLNRIIRLQAALEIITNKTASALDLLTRQSQEMRTAILQHRMVLDYLLAEEGGVCGKLNISNCCLEISDVGEVVLQLTEDIRKIAHVPSQTWNGLQGDLWSWLPGASWLKQLLFYLLCGLAALMFLPCIIPCLIQLIQHVVTNMQATVLTSPDGTKQVRLMKQAKITAVRII